MMKVQTLENHLPTLSKVLKLRIERRTPLITACRELKLHPNFATHLICQLKRLPPERFSVIVPKDLQDLIQESKRLHVPQPRATYTRKPRTLRLQSSLDADTARKDAAKVQTPSLGRCLNLLVRRYGTQASFKAIAHLEEKRGRK
jgi:hypothetical protein